MDFGGGGIVVDMKLVEMLIEVRCPVTFQKAVSRINICEGRATDLESYSRAGCCTPVRSRKRVR
jgi:hypothetical protein